MQPRYAAGQTVMARFGTDWVPARVNKVVRTNGPEGPRFQYDVVLANNHRGVVPERMLRPAQ